MNTYLSFTRYGMSNRDLTLLLEDDPGRCAGLNTRCSTRCSRRNVTHPTGLCSTHRHQEYACRLCGDPHTCKYHAPGGRNMNYLQYTLDGGPTGAASFSLVCEVCGTIGELDRVSLLGVVAVAETHDLTFHSRGDGQ